MYKFMIDGHNVEFRNYSRWNKEGSRLWCEGYGWHHTSTLYIDGKRIATGRCDYMNRTWESYQFQSSMRKAVYSAKRVALVNTDLLEKIEEKIGF